MNTAVGTSPPSGPSSARLYPDLDYPATIGGCLNRAAAIFGDRDFVVLPDRRITFAQVELASRHLARRMLAAGIGKGSRVGMLFTFGPEFCIAWLAALRIGALAMPLSSTYKPAELRRVVGLGDISLLVAPPTLLGRAVPAMLEDAFASLGRAQGDRLFLEEAPYLRAIWVTGETDRQWCTSVALDKAGPSGPPIAANDALFRAVEAAVVPADLAQVTYTSGSSALPKGVVHTHGSIVRNTSPSATEWSVRSVGAPWPAGSVFCGFPFFWIGGTLTLGQALQLGWTVSCLERFEPGLALDLIERERPDRIAAWPSLIQALRTDPSIHSRDLSWLSGLGTTPAVGSGPGPTRHRGMSETMGNWYGVQTKVIDPQTLVPLPDGTEGELLVRGWAVTQGYYKTEREDVFDPDGWLHTGDRVTRENGRIWFTGRFTELIKSHGANVSPREVEAALENYPDVRHAIVFGLPHPDREEEVTAVVVPAPGKALDPATLGERARRDLSSFKVPTRIHVVADEATLPWLATGKPDKRRLRDQVVSGDLD